MELWQTFQAIFRAIRQHVHLLYMLPLNKVALWSLLQHWACCIERVLWLTRLTRPLLRACTVLCLEFRSAIYCTPCCIHMRCDCCWVRCLARLQRCKVTAAVTSCLHCRFLRLQAKSAYPHSSLSREYTLRQIPKALQSPLRMAMTPLSLKTLSRSLRSGVSCIICAAARNL